MSKLLEEYLQLTSISEYLYSISEYVTIWRILIFYWYFRNVGFPDATHRLSSSEVLLSLAIVFSILAWCFLHSHCFLFESWLPILLFYEKDLKRNQKTILHSLTTVFSVFVAYGNSLFYSHSLPTTFFTRSRRVFSFGAYLVCHDRTSGFNEPSGNRFPFHTGGRFSCDICNVFKAIHKDDAILESEGQW